MDGLYGYCFINIFILSNNMNLINFIYLLFFGIIVFIILGEGLDILRKYFKQKKYKNKL